MPRIVTQVIENEEDLHYHDPNDDGTGGDEMELNETRMHLNWDGFQKISE